MWFSFGADMAFFDAGARRDPFVAGIHHLSEIVIGQHALWNLFSPANDPGISPTHGFDTP
jgi:hypothetical protein